MIIIASAWPAGICMRYDQKVGTEAVLPWPNFQRWILPR